MEQQKQKCVAVNVESRSTGKRKVTVGSVWESKRCGEFEVVEIRNMADIDIAFIDTGYKSNTTTAVIRKGHLMDKLHSSVCGVGFIGAGEFKTKVNGKDDRACKSWRSIMYRCYDKKWHERSPTYKGCTVCKEWHNYQNFAKWYYDNYPKDGSYYEIDKDIRVPLNKVYSPDTCIFVDDAVNSFVIDSGATRGRYMIGVTMHNRSGRLASRCRNPITGIRENLGYFDTELKAHLAWRKRKSELAYELAMIQDREEVKQALLNWKEALDNNLIHPY